MSVLKTKIICLHLGTYKTATTFLQHILWNNFKDSSGSVYYPRIGTYGTAHHYLATSEFPWWMNGVTQAEHEKTWKLLLDEIAGSTADFVLISSEMFCSLYENSIHYIRDMLRDYSVRAIIYLRPQDQFISSLAEQFVKGSNYKPEYYMDLNKAIYGIRTSSRFDYGNMCTQWACAIGEENLIVRPFEPNQLYNGSILADFFHHLLGMPSPEFLEFPAENLNPRLCRDALEFKQLVNRMPIDRETMNATLPGLLAYSKAVDARTQNAYQEHVLLSPSQRLEILQSYTDINAQIARKYLGRKDGVLFRDPMTNPTAEWTPYPGLSTSTLADIVHFLGEVAPDVVELLVQAIPGIDQIDHKMRRLAHVLTRYHSPDKLWERIMPGFLRKFIGI